MNKIHIHYWKSPVGEMILASYQDKLCLADWRYRKMRPQIDARIQRLLQSDYQLSSSSVIEQAREQLGEYFNRQRKTFDLPLLLAGSEFQQKVWRGLQAIEFGQTQSYGQLAAALGQPRAVRAVANANGANALSIIVPCHRIIGARGELVGYAGGLSAKQKLLEIEQDLFAV